VGWSKLHFLFECESCKLSEVNNAIVLNFIFNCLTVASCSLLMRLLLWIFLIYVGALMDSPAHIMPLLEIVRTNRTSAQVILDLIALGKTIKKVPVVVGNCTGFAVNRTFFPYSQSAHLLANLGVDVFKIDRVITEFGLPMGPFQ